MTRKVIASITERAYILEVLSIAKVERIGTKVLLDKHFTIP